MTPRTPAPVWGLLGSMLAFIHGQSIAWYDVGASLHMHLDSSSLAASCAILRASIEVSADLQALCMLPAIAA